MNRALLLERLALAERHIAQSYRHVARQRELVDNLDDNGREVAAATVLLREFEQMLHLHLADRTRIRSMLEDLPERQLWTGSG